MTLRLATGLALINSLLYCAAAAAAAEKPNIVFIFIDDMGYGDLGCYGNEDVTSPNIDRLAEEGIRFTQFYVNSPICSPSRVAVTTGQFPARHRINSFLAARKRNRQRHMADFLDPSVPCIARTFQQAGYATAHFGKWHMGGGRDVDDAPLPSAYGFDEHFVNFEGMGPKIERTKTPKHRWTEIYVDRSIDFVTRRREEPFYLHLWLNDVHDKLVPKPDLIEKYASASPNKYVRQYLAVIEEMDRQIGRLVATIGRLGLDERTMIVVASDNGPTAWPKYYREGLDPPGSTAGLRGRKWSLYEGGIREPFIVRFPGRVPAGRVDKTTVVAAIDLFPTFCAIAGVRASEVSFDGINVSQALLGQPLERTRALLWEYRRDQTYLKPGHPNDQSPNLAIRAGNWKLLINADGSHMELYALDTDWREARNVAEQHPGIANRLSDRLLAWRESLP